MATSPTIQYLQLDASYDPILDPTANLTDADAVSQAIQTRLNLFLGEWWEDLNLGLPVFQSMLGQLGSPQGIAAMQLAVQQTIQGTPYVTSSSPTVSFESGKLSISYTAQTAFGQVSGSVNAPALNSVGLGA
jgi:hypothetical protein